MAHNQRGHSRPVGSFEPHVFEEGRNPIAVHLSRYMTGPSRETVRISLERVARFASGGAIEARAFPWHQLQFHHVAEIRQRIQEAGYEPATGNHSLSCLRELIRTCWSMEMITAEDRDRLTRVRGFRESGLLRGRALSQAELAKLFGTLVAAGESDARATRDAAILAILFGAGLRRLEAIRLDLADYDPKGASLSVRGKGGRIRMSYLAPAPSRILDDWIEKRARQPGPLLCGVSRSGAVEIRRTSPRAIHDLCQRWAKRAEIAPFSPHDLRRTFVSGLLDAGVDLSTVRSMAGHSLVTTTVRYDRRGLAAQQAAVGLLTFPSAEPAAEAPNSAKAQEDHR